MSVQKIYAGGKFYEAADLDSDANNTQKDANVNRLLIAGVLCNDSKIKEDGENYTRVGDPTETALILLAKKAGIERHAFDGKGFHGLRRRLARNMLVTGTPVTTIAQVLGHESMETAKQYLSLDSRNLKECALNFSCIPLERGGLL